MPLVQANQAFLPDLDWGPSTAARSFGVGGREPWTQLQTQQTDCDVWVMLSTCQLCTLSHCLLDSNAVLVNASPEPGDGQPG